MSVILGELTLSLLKKKCEKGTGHTFPIRSFQDSITNCTEDHVVANNITECMKKPWQEATSS